MRRWLWAHVRQILTPLLVMLVIAGVGGGFLFLANDHSNARTDRIARTAIRNGNLSACALKIVLQPLLDRSQAALEKATAKSDRASLGKAIQTYSLIIGAERTEPADLDCHALLHIKETS